MKKGVDGDAVELVRDITYKMCDRDFDLDLVQETFADDFVHHANGATSDKAAYLARGREYRAAFSSIDRPEFDELFAVGDRVVAAYTLQLHRREGGTDRLAVTAIWTLADGRSPPYARSTRPRNRPLPRRARRPPERTRS